MLPSLSLNISIGKMTLMAFSFDFCLPDCIVQAGVLFYQEKRTIKFEIKRLLQFIFRKPIG
jgi:hypothetical protein